jgi:2-oxoglutarate/2-oxoacid ferredoxin oxidoreductase subunit beta
MTTDQTKITMKDLKAADPRWCTGCGDYTILVGLRKFMVNYQLKKEDTINVSGIGCSGRIPHYMNTYGFHGIHGRAVPLALGSVLADSNFNVFIHSGDGDSLSIGGNHLLHGIHKNFNCVYMLYDNEIYGLTKNQSSPTTRQGLSTMTQPKGTALEPINPVRFALGAGASFVASTAEWMPKHMLDCIEAAFNHKGFALVHIAQRCPKFNPTSWSHKTSDWVSFIEHDDGIKADLKSAPDAKVIKHDPSDLGHAFEVSEGVPDRFGLFYKAEKANYDQLIDNQIKDAKQLSKDDLLDPFKI